MSKKVQTAALIIDGRDKFNQGRRGKVVAEMVNLISRYELTYDEFIECGKVAREQMQLVRKVRVPVSKPVPSMDDVKKFMQVIERQSPADSLMMKMLIFLGIRSCELVSIKIGDIDLTPGTERIFVRRKAGLDKWFVIPEKLTSLLRMYLTQAEKQVYLFEPAGKYHQMYSREAIRKKIQKYRKEAEVGEVIHAHNFRHLLLTILGGQGWTDSELQLISGHASRTSLDSYIHRNPETVRTKLNDTLSRMITGV